MKRSVLAAALGLAALPAAAGEYAVSEAGFAIGPSFAMSGDSPLEERSFKDDFDTGFSFNVYAVGPIMTGKSKTEPFGGTILGSTTIVEALRKANDDKQVAAIVLRIDSPGGSALASDLIWHETQVIDKPIVASMGDVAASGGYYIAMGADKIVAAPGTVTGSIGVVGGKLGIRGLYKKLGITTETIQRGRNSGLFASSRGSSMTSSVASPGRLDIAMLPSCFSAIHLAIGRPRPLPSAGRRALPRMR